MHVCSGLRFSLFVHTKQFISLLILCSPSAPDKRFAKTGLNQYHQLKPLL